MSPNDIISFLSFSLLLGGLGVPKLSLSESLWFPPELITGQTIADIALLKDSQQLPGIYRVTLLVNGEQVGIRDVEFVTIDNLSSANPLHDETGLRPCLSRTDFVELGVKLALFEANQLSDKAAACVDIQSLIPKASVMFDFANMQLNISIPQVWMESRPKGWVSPERWDDGITAGLLNYTFSGVNQSGKSGQSQNYYLRLNSGLNWGAWRLRNERTLREYRGDTYSQREWNYGRTWVTRAIKPWLSELLIGDGSTSGTLFEATSFRGVQLHTDENMLPHSLRGYAPVIRGIAFSNAQVVVYQNGHIVYNINVAPGPFEINDIIPIYTSGELKVSVTEADGSERIFTIPYASLPSLLRQGAVQYELTVGQLIGNGIDSEPRYIQGMLARGLPNDVTVYVGLQYAELYQAIALGSSISLGYLGALSADVTVANSQLADGQSRRGQSLRFLYSRAFDALGTTVQLAGYRYSTEGFYTLSENYRSRMSGWLNEQQRDTSGQLKSRSHDDWFDLTQKRREKMEVNLTQRIGDNSSLFVTGTRETFWGRRGNSLSLQTGVSSFISDVSYSFSYNETRNSSLKNTDRSIYFGISMPLTRRDSGSPVYLSSSMNRGSEGELTQQVGLSGTLLAQNNMNWSVNQGFSQRNGNSSNVHVGYNGRYGNVSAGYSRGRDYRQVSYDLRGGVILHSGGMTIGQPLGQTAVLVSAEGESGIPLSSNSGIKTDWQGYAIYPWVSEYQTNRVAVDVGQLNEQLDIGSPVTHVMPSKGAVVRADFQIKRGARVLMKLIYNEKPLPMGAVINVSSNGVNSVGIVGDDGQVYLSGLSSKGSIMGKWGNQPDQQCQADWVLEETKEPSLQTISISCE
ncbi:fimbria/pilus outer membrane usher protein [Providencia sp. JUb39]|uniref:fimbria/pilus outer membrane usher protein n=1 Tax=Providencia sp. JUb39 TaxID=2724165 RepID=UPI00164E1028|nr:fimbria/pilus outer membrane usher protein [Providencia sp. JUb39]MBC5792347.1 fimbrial biogenesis outer membrane usher protein [Providencia sp. JUb39]